jgi:aromatic ring-opening dioxygenase LigB subunit
VLRAEVHLTEAKAIHTCTSATDTAKQIADLSENSEKIFLDVFTRIVPFGDFYKKDRAVEMIRAKVSDIRLRRRCLRLLELIPEKRSLLLAQKALHYRRIDDVMEAFADIKVSPVTIGKRHDVKKLDNIYKYM